MGELLVDLEQINMMLLKAAVLLSVVSVSYGCNMAIINQILNVLSNPPTTTTMKPTTMKPTTTMNPATTMMPPSNCTCGKANKKTKIVNGVETEEHEYPWQVGLTFGSTNYYASCGGSIISNKNILTAAHCTARKSPGGIYVMV